MTDSHTPNPNGEAVIEDGYIVIRVAVAHLPMIVQGASDVLDGALFGLDAKVADAPALAEEIRRNLNEENEVGTTPIHKMFDAAILEAIEQGGDGIELSDAVECIDCGTPGPLEEDDRCEACHRLAQEH